MSQSWKQSSTRGPERSRLELGTDLLHAKHTHNTAQGRSEHTLRKREQIIGQYRKKRQGKLDELERQYDADVVAVDHDYDEFEFKHLEAVDQINATLKKRQEDHEKTLERLEQTIKRSKEEGGQKCDADDVQPQAQ